MTALALMIRPTRNGWAVCLSNGQELVHYRGPFSKHLAVRYLERYGRGIRPAQSEHRKRPRPSDPPSANSPD